MTLDMELVEPLRTVMDPEIGVNIVDLGLIYGAWRKEGGAHVVMTMTSPACPLADVIGEDVRTALLSHFPEFLGVDLELVFDPPWDPSRMSDAARAVLG